MAVNERFNWGAEVLKIEPSDTILEIGCGTGIFVEQIGRKLISGKIVAVDKSASMIEMARKRNKALLEKSVVRFIVSDFIKAEFDNLEFNKVVAFNVNVFWKNPSKELKMVKKHLKSAGQLYVFYQTPFGIGDEFIRQLTQPLENNEFEIIEIILNKLISNPVVCIIARPK
jgi:ubiquinone/menaquinone biosynthesis C-methylase UbiE